MQDNRISVVLDDSLQNIALTPGQLVTGQVKLTRMTQQDSIQSIAVILEGTAEAIYHRARGKSVMPLLYLEYQLARNESLPPGRTIIWPFSIRIPNQVREAHCYGSQFDGRNIYVAVPQHASGVLPLPPTFKDRSGHPLRSFSTEVTYELAAKARYSGHWLGHKQRISISSASTRPDAAGQQANNLQASGTFQFPRLCSNNLQRPIMPGQNRLWQMLFKSTKSASSTDDFRIMTSMKNTYHANDSNTVKLWYEQLESTLKDCDKDYGSLLVQLISVRARLMGITHYRIAAQAGFEVGNFKSQLHVWNLCTNLTIGGSSDPECFTLSSPRLGILTETFSTLNVSRTYSLLLVMRLKCVGKNFKVNVQHPIEVQGHGTVQESLLAEHRLAEQDTLVTPEVSRRGLTPPPAYVS